MTMTKQKQPPQADVKRIKELINLNPDSRQYFYTKADERWLSWLWGNGFLDVIKEKAEDPTRYGYRMPELNYLVKVSKKKPAKVVDIMLKVPISAENFNPEVVDGFLRICGQLPAEQLARMAPKIRDDNWVRLMGGFNSWGIEYEKILKILADAKDFRNLLTVAQTILTIRTKDEIGKITNRITTAAPFYFSDLRYTKVFEYFGVVDDMHAEEVLALTTNTMHNIVLMGEKESTNKVFDVGETFYLFDVDFFTLELDRKSQLSYEDDVKNLAAIIKQYAVRTIGKQCGDVKLVTKLYGKYFESLPDSRSMWRLRLSVLSLCPETFKDDLRKAFFRLFETDRYYELISGTEYKKALRAGFSVLSESDKRKYVSQVLEYFSKHAQGNEDQKWRKRHGWEILSSICEQLTDEENKRCEKTFGEKCDVGFEPKPSIGEMRGGTVVPRGPITQEEFSNLSIAEISKKLRTEWAPEKLRAQNSNDDFLHPLNAEGAGELLRIDISKRSNDYIKNANHFFERDVLDPHYTYSFLRGVQEVLHGNKTDTSGINWGNLIALCVAVRESGETESFDRGAHERDTSDAWLSGWTGVHSAMTDVIKELLSEDRDNIIIDFSNYRDKFLAIISYLLAYPDPVPTDERIESAGMKTKSSDSEEWLVSDPFTMAINTVRGRAFQALVLFVYQDGKKFSKEESSKISSDLKELYEILLKNEKTRALMFMFGYYLPSFYFRDKKWMQGLLSQIFPTASEKKDLYTAAWEGYVSTNLYEEMFFDANIQKLYERGLTLKDTEYPKQKHFREPDEGIAAHLALAFIHFSKFGFEHDLFKKFWGTENLKRHKEFISFIGRSSISREAAAEWIKQNKVDIEKLKKFWDWALEHCNTDALAGFGFWINVELGALDIKWVAPHVCQTLEKTKGYVEWEYGLTRSLVVFAKAAPEDTLAILRAHLLEEVAKHEPIRTWLYADDEVFDAFKELYKNEATRGGVRTLINDLLPYRNGLFWSLKSVLNEV